MKAKRLHLSKMAIGLFILFTAASCGKDDNGDGGGTPTYIPSAIYANGTPVDSFTYNSDDAVDKMFYSFSSSSQIYREYLHFGYAANGKCNRVAAYHTDGNELQYVDTLIYTSNETAKIHRYYPNETELDEGTTLKFGRDGLMLIGSKDTVKTESEKRLYYYEFTWTGGNLSVLKIANYYEPTSGSVSGSTSLFTRGYDNKPNGLWWLFKKNPLAGFLILSSEEMLFASVGKNNVTSLKMQFGNEANDITVTNIFDPVSGYVSEQKYKLGDEEAAGLQFHYIKTK
jgi:hypothetical protein